MKKPKQIFNLVFVVYRNCVFCDVRAKVNSHLFTVNVDFS